MPFRAAIEAGVASLMTAHVAYPALDPEGLPATLSSRDPGRPPAGGCFDGLVVTDALIMDGALVGRRESDAARGGDSRRAWICCSTPTIPGGCCDALEQAACGRHPPRARLAQSLERYERALAQPRSRRRR